MGNFAAFAPILPRGSGGLDTGWGLEPGAKPAPQVQDLGNPSGPYPEKVFGKRSGFSGKLYKL